MLDSWPTDSPLARIKALNQHPLNREAKRWLLDAQVDVQDHQLYLLQLMWWGLDEGKLFWGNEPARRLRELLSSIVLDLLEQSNQTNVLRLMTVGISADEDDQNLSLGTLEHAQDSRDAAWRTLDALHTQLRLRM